MAPTVLATKAQYDTVEALVDGLGEGTVLIAPGDSARVISFTAMGANFRMRGARVIARKSGSLRHLHYFAGNVITGTVRAGIYDVGNTTSGLRTKVWDSGVVTPPGTLQYVLLGDPQLPVVAGRHFDFVLQFDTSAAEFPSFAGAAGVATLPSALVSSIIGGCQYKQSWFAAAASLVLPTTVDETTAAISANIPITIGEVV